MKQVVRERGCTLAFIPELVILATLPPKRSSLPGASLIAFLDHHRLVQRPELFLMTVERNFFSPAFLRAA